MTSFSWTHGVAICLVLCGCSRDQPIPQLAPLPSSGYERPTEVARPLSAPPPGIVEELLGTRWRATTPTSVWSTFTVGTSMLYHQTRDGNEATLRMESSSPLCLGYPNCVVVQPLQGEPTPYYFWRNGDTLHVVLCTQLTAERLVDGALPTRQELEASSGMRVVFAERDVLCLDPRTDIFERVAITAPAAQPQ